MTIELCRGIDVSAIQGDISEKDWEAIAGVGVRFAYIRLLVGNETWTDSASLKRNVERAKKAGIACGAYFFPYPLPHLDPNEQVERFVKLLDGLGSNVGELPPAYDAEWPPDYTKRKDGTVENTWAKWGCTGRQICDWHLNALKRGEHLTGVPWTVYSYRYHLKVIDAASNPEFAEHRLWLADYFASGRWPEGDEVSKRPVPRPWREISIIQHDGDGGLRMPNGRDADFNVMLGGEAALQTFTQTEGEDMSSRVNAEVDLSWVRADNTRIILDSDIEQYRRDRYDDLVEVSG